MFYFLPSVVVVVVVVVSLFCLFVVVLCLFFGGFVWGGGRNQLFQKKKKGIQWQCQTVWAQMRPNVFVGRNLGPNCLRQLSADDTSR